MASPAAATAPATAWAASAAVLSTASMASRASSLAASSSAAPSAKRSRTSTRTGSQCAETLWAGVPSQRHASSSEVAVTETVEPTACGGVRALPASARAANHSPST